MLSRKKKILAGILSLMLLIMSGSQMASAADNEIQPRGPIAYCTKCGTTTSHVIRTERGYSYDSYDTCIHGKPGMYDKYKVYAVHTYYKCTRCGTEQYVKTEEDRVYERCVYL